MNSNNPLSENNASSGTAPAKRAITAEGRVVSNKMDKTVVVVIEWQRPHPRYGKVMRYQTRLYAHDEHNSCAIGDRVVISQVRPLSKKKRWQLLSIKEKAVQA